jgi:hypothetical protein
MSWITGITGKAEQLLNKLDQSAADAWSNGSLLFKKSNNASSVFNFFLALPVCAVVDDGFTMVCGFLMDGVTISDGL